MLRSILFATDGFEISNTAQQSSISLAKRFDAKITALGVADIPMHITAEGKVRELSGGKRRAQDALRRMRAAAEAAGIAVDTRELTDDLTAPLRVEAVRHDVLVMGRSTGFRWDAKEGELDRAIFSLVRDGSRPVLAVRDKAATADRIIVAFDGSIPASRSMYLAALLGLTQNSQVQVLSISANDRTAEELAEGAATLLRNHGGNISAFGIGSEADPAEIILSHVKTFEPDILVMGAYGRSGLRDMLFGSCTRRLLAECGTALFLQH